jgi:hypothetical protein
MAGKDSYGGDHEDCRLLGFNPEEGGKVFLCIVHIYLEDYMASHPKDCIMPDTADECSTTQHDTSNDTDVMYSICFATDGNGQEFDIVPFSFKPASLPSYLHL